MISMGRTKHLPNLADYLQARAAKHPKSRTDAYIVGGAIAVSAVALGVASIVGRLTSSWASVGIALGVSLVVFGAGFAAWAVGRLRPRSEEDVRIRTLYKAIDQYHASLSRRKLHRELDPVAAQLLEACAHYWKRVQATLGGPFWTGSLSAAYRGVREEAIEAADRAMDEAVVLCASCMGAPSKSKADDLKSVFQDFADLDISDAMEGLKRIAKADSRDYAHRSPNLQTVFEPVRDIAEKLKMLSSEVERMSQRAMTETKLSGGLTTGAASLDDVLGDIRSIQQAEAELDQQRLQQ